MLAIPLIFTLLGLSLGADHGEVPQMDSDSHDAQVDPQFGLPEHQPFIDVFPPNNYPGEVFPKTAFDKVDQALDEVMKSGTLLQDRRCALAVVNLGEISLVNPQWALTGGRSHSALPLEIPAGSTGLNLFTKADIALSGTDGILSYDLKDTTYKLVIYWQVPYDRLFYNVKFNVKVYKQDVATDKALANHLGGLAGPFPADSWHTRTEYGVKLTATMTDNTKSKLIVNVDTSEFDPNGGYDLFTECKYKASAIGNRCTQECYGKSWCWVDKKCGNANDCKGRHVCKSKC